MLNLIAINHSLAFLNETENKHETRDNLTVLPHTLHLKFKLDHNRRISYYLNKMLNQSIS